MRITLNGQGRDVPDGTTVARFLETLGERRGPVAVEVNRQIVPRSQYADQCLADGDAVEIVTLVGGG